MKVRAVCSAMVAIVAIAGISGFASAQDTSPAVTKNKRNKVTIESTQSDMDAEALRVMILLAEDGDLQSQLDLSMMYALGRGVPVDASQSYRWALMAAEQGDPTGQHFTCLHLLETAETWETGKEWCALAADQGYAPAIDTLATLGAPPALADRPSFQDGLDAFADSRPEDAALIWTPLAEQGDVEAQYRLALLFRSKQIEGTPADAGRWYEAAANAGHPLATAYIEALPFIDALEREDYATAIPLIATLAEAGNPEALRQLGLFHAYGDAYAFGGPPMDVDKALDFLQKAADADLTMFEDAVTSMYLLLGGADVQTGMDAFNQGQYQEALNEWVPLADKGLAAAQHNVGIILSEGRTAPVDDARAAHYWQGAAEQGMAVSQLALGKAYLAGRGVVQDPAEGARWITQAADQGNLGALLTLAFMYGAGEGVAQDFSEELRLYQLAAEQNDATAQYYLGEIYNEGRGTAQDLVKSVDWYTKSANNGDADAAGQLCEMYLVAAEIGADDDKAADFCFKAVTGGNRGVTAFVTGPNRSATSIAFRRNFQTLLAGTGYYSGSIDGDFGPGTLAAIEAAFGSGMTSN